MGKAGSGYHGREQELWEGRKRDLGANMSSQVESIKYFRNQVCIRRNIEGVATVGHDLLSRFGLLYIPGSGHVIDDLSLGVHRRCQCCQCCQ